MRRAILALLLCSCLLLTGCSELREVENLAFAVILGVDLVENNQIEVSIQIPKISGQTGGESSGSSADSSELVYSARGDTFEVAQKSLQWIVPRRLDLSQLKLIVVSEALARSPRFLEVANAMTDTYRIYTAARLAVCEGNVKSFLEKETLQIGARMVTELTAMFEDYTYNGFAPDVQFADFYYSSVSIYSDPLTLYAASAPADENAQVSSEESKPAFSVLVPPDIATDEVGTPQENRFLGAAVMRQGMMVGRLDGPQTLCCMLLRGKNLNFLFEIDGVSVSLATSGSPRISVAPGADPLKIDVRMRFIIQQDRQDYDIERLRAALEQSLTDVIDACKQMGAEPFLFAERAARSFPTIGDWQNYDWLGRFLESEVSVQVELQRSDA